MFKYEIIIYWSSEDEAYIAEVPELPGCMADGSSYKEVLENGANGGGSSPSVYLKNPEDIALVLANVEDNSINVDLTFKKKIKVI
jgi:hypothetical protein